MGDSPSPPPLIQPGPTAATQFNYNKQAQSSSEPFQWGPYGSITSAVVGKDQYGNPLYGQSTQLTPEEQMMLGLQQAGGVEAGAGVTNLLGEFNAQNPSQLGDMASGLTGERMKAYEASVDPYMEQQKEALASTLANQGLTPGTPAYDNAMRNLIQGQTQGMAGAAAQFEPQAWQQAMQEYEMPLLNAQTETGFNNPQIPGEINYPSLAPPNYEGDVSSFNSAQVAAYQAQLQAQSNFFMGVGNLAMGAAKLFTISDRRLKSDIRRVAKIGKAVIYSYRMGGKRWLGVMADQVRSFAPSATKKFGDYWAVDYSALGLPGPVEVM